MLRNVKLMMIFISLLLLLLFLLGVHRASSSGLFLGNHPDCGLLPRKSALKRAKPSAKPVVEEFPEFGGHYSDLSTPNQIYPWMARLYGHGHDLREFLCGATILTERWALTAGHCLQNGSVPYPIEGFIFQAGWTRLGRAAMIARQYRSIQRAIVHHRFRTDGISDFDIGLVKLDRELSFHQVEATDHMIAPICLPTRRKTPLQGTTVTVLGWGYESVMDPRMPCPRLREATGQVWSDRECKKAVEESIHQEQWRAYTGGLGYNYTGPEPGWQQDLDSDFEDDTDSEKQKHKRRIRWTSRHICWGQRGVLNFCDGDSGGPMAAFDGGRWVQYGVISYAVECNQTNPYTGCHECYCRASMGMRVSEFIRWIWEQVNGGGGGGDAAAVEAKVPFFEFSNTFPYVRFNGFPIM